MGRERGRIGKGMRGIRLGWNEETGGVSGDGYIDEMALGIPWTIFS